MSVVAARKFVALSLTVGMLALAGGCAVLDVELRSSPDAVRAGDPVYFDIKLTNRSRCPLETSVALLVAFIPEREFDFGLGEEFPAETPSEVKDFINRIQRFFDKLCRGDKPELPEFPDLVTTCRQGEGEILCQMSGPLQQGSSTNMTFAGLGDRLQCEVDDATMSCQLRLALPEETADGSAAGNAGNDGKLSCISFDEFGRDGISSLGSGAICFVGRRFPNIGGLGPEGMAEGMVALKARGVGVVRNLVFAFADDKSDLGVCRDGEDAGDACELEDDDCYEGSCEAGICVGGGDAGEGCDPTLSECSGEACVQTECSGGTCVACDNLAQDSFLPIDCTTTVIEPEPAPAMSPWGLAIMAAALLVFGSLWLQRRGRRA